MLPVGGMKGAMRMTKIGFLGFGEAGSRLAEGLAAAGMHDITAYDIDWERSELVRRRAADGNVRLVHSPSQLAEHSDVVFSAVVCTEAEAAAQSIAPHLAKEHLYLDINSTSPGVKWRISEGFIARGLAYVDVAVMSNVISDLAGLPMLAAGAAADDVPQLFPGVPLDITTVSSRPGDASRIKMLRSLFVKGLEALTIEVMLAAYPADIHEVVLNSFEETFSAYTFPELVQHLIARHAVHGERRASELSEVAAALREVGVEPVMAEAAAERASWDVRRGLQAHFDKEVDPDWLDVLAVLDSLRD